jgi:hypothetical protein
MHGSILSCLCCSQRTPGRRELEQNGSVKTSNHYAAVYCRFLSATHRGERIGRNQNPSHCDRSNGLLLFHSPSPIGCRTDSFAIVCQSSSRRSMRYAARGDRGPQEDLFHMEDPSTWFSSWMRGLRGSSVYFTFSAHSRMRSSA